MEHPEIERKLSVKTFTDNARVTLHGSPNMNIKELVYSAQLLLEAADTLRRNGPEEPIKRAS